MTKILRCLIALSSIPAVLLVGACAAPADPGRMVAISNTPGAREFPATLRNGVCIRGVTGGEETNPLWVSKVGDTEFRDAFARSLRESGLLAPPTGCRYIVEVHLLGLSQPIGGFSAEVTAHINYKVFNSAGTPVLLETISATHTVGPFDAYAFATRLQHANEGAIRDSIEQFLQKLRATSAAKMKAESNKG